MVDMVNHQHEDCSKCVSEWMQWARVAVRHPIQGFEDKKNSNGSGFSISQQQEVTHTQIELIIYDLCSRKKSSTNIHSIISAFAR